MTCWPCSSASALRTDASGPGSSPWTFAETVRKRISRSTSDSMKSAASRCRSTGSVTVPLRAHEVEQVVGGRPDAPERPLARQRHAFVAQRDLGQTPAVVLRADDVRRGDPHVVEEDLVEGRFVIHLLDRPDGDAGRLHVEHEVRDPPMRLRVRVGASEQDAVAGELRQRGPDLLAVEHVLVAVAHRARRERREVAAGFRLAEQLAPDLGAVEQAGEVALLLLGGPRDEERRARPSRCRSGSSASGRTRA